jgi:hypothetical protein
LYLLAHVGQLFTQVGDQGMAAERTGIPLGDVEVVPFVGYLQLVAQRCNEPLPNRQPGIGGRPGADE